MKSLVAVGAAVICVLAGHGAESEGSHRVAVMAGGSSSGGLSADTVTSPPGSGACSGIMERLERIKISGTLEAQVRAMDHGNDPIAESGPMTDLYFRLFELGVETSFSDWATAIAVLNSEWIGDPLNEGDEKLTVDEIHFDVREPEFPLYFILGKRTLPFGQFENALVSDPITQDAYEIKKVGATIGVSGAFDADLSITAFKGDELMRHLHQSALFDTAIVRRVFIEHDHVESYIVSASVTPFGDLLTVFGGFASEPGGNRRDATADVGLSIKLPSLENVSIDAEYVKAVARELYVINGGQSEREFREGVFAATLSYSFVMKRSIIRNRGLYRARKQYRASHPVEAALRIEHFDDDELSSTCGAWSVKDRYLGGGRYTLYAVGDVSVYLGFEYRRTGYRVPPGAARGVGRANEEYYVSLGLDF